MSEHAGAQPPEQRRPDDIDALFPGRFLKGADLNGREQTVEIVDVWGEDLEGQKGVKPKAIVSFKRATPGPRELVLAKINSACLKAMFGSKRSAWLGKRVTFYATDKIMPMPSGENKGRACLRVMGSPDITEPIAVTFAPPRRRPVTMVMKVTGSKPRPAPSPNTAPQPQRETAERDDEPNWPDMDAKENPST